MRILYHHRIASKDGQYVHIEELIQALKNLGHEVIMVGPAVVEQARFGSNGGVVSLLKRLMPRALYETLELAYSLVAYMRLRRAVLAYKPDCLYERYNLFMPAGVWIKHRYQLPMLLEVNAPLFEERSRYGRVALSRLARWSENYTWRGADYVLPVTQVLADRISGVGVDSERIRVIPNGINLSRFGGHPDMLACKSRLGLSGKIVLGFTGFVREWHGLDKVVALLKTMGDAYHLLIVGDGPARKRLEDQAQSLGVADQLTITGIVDRDHVAEYIAAFDIALQPNIVPYASPLKLFEYLALGRATVAPDTPNVREVLRHEVNGLLFDPTSETGLTKAVERLCKDDHLRRTLAHNGRQTIFERGMTWDNNAKHVESLFYAMGIRPLDNRNRVYRDVRQEMVR